MAAGTAMNGVLALAAQPNLNLNPRRFQPQQHRPRSAACQLGSLQPATQANRHCSQRSSARLRQDVRPVNVLLQIGNSNASPTGKLTSASASANANANGSAGASAGANASASGSVGSRNRATAGSSHAVPGDGPAGTALPGRLAAASGVTEAPEAAVTFLATDAGLATVNGNSSPTLALPSSQPQLSWVRRLWTHQDFAHLHAVSSALLMLNSLGIALVTGSAIARGGTDIWFPTHWFEFYPFLAITLVSNASGLVMASRFRKGVARSVFQTTALGNLVNTIFQWWLMPGWFPEPWRVPAFEASFGVTCAVLAVLTVTTLEPALAMASRREKRSWKVLQAQGLAPSDSKGHETKAAAAVTTSSAAAVATSSAAAVTTSSAASVLVAPPVEKATLVGNVAAALAAGAVVEVVDEPGGSSALAPHGPGKDSPPWHEWVGYLFPVLYGTPLIWGQGKIILVGGSAWLAQMLAVHPEMVVWNMNVVALVALNAGLGSFAVTLRDRAVISREAELAIIAGTTVPVLCFFVWGLNVAYSSWLPELLWDTMTNPLAIGGLPHPGF